MNKKKISKSNLFYWVKVDYNFDEELYYTDAKAFAIESIVIVETKHGLETGKIIDKSIPISILNNTDRKDYPKILRLPTDKEIAIRKKNIGKIQESFNIANEKIKFHKLPLKLLRVHHFLDEKKIMFYFYCENRVDFRLLVRDLASIFKVRIELRQVGVRDKAMFIGGYGVCGRQFCCTLFRTNKDPKSIKMAREQNLTLNSMRISGVCGRLLCCLDFEYCQYHGTNCNSIKTNTEILLNSDVMSKIIKVDKQKRIITIKTINGDEFSIPFESIIINKETGKCQAFI